MLPTSSKPSVVAHVPAPLLFPQQWNSTNICLVSIVTSIAASELSKCIFTDNCQLPSQTAGANGSFSHTQWVDDQTVQCELINYEVWLSLIDD